MKNTFQIVESNKFGLNSEESHVVTRGQLSFLRILGSHPQWEIMTATADEDNSPIKVCNNQQLLVKTALQLGTELKTSPCSKKDWLGREYVKICMIISDQEESQQDFFEELFEILNRFFKLYDEYQAKDEMRELYDALAIDDEGSDVYLCDGVWLSNDGLTHDRGR